MEIQKLVTKQIDQTKDTIIGVIFLDKSDEIFENLIKTLDNMIDWMNQPEKEV